MASPACAPIGAATSLCPPTTGRSCRIPDMPADRQAPYRQLVDNVLGAKRTDSAADVSAIERKIDRLVYRLYGLTAEEVAIVKGQ